MNMFKHWENSITVSETKLSCVSVFVFTGLLQAIFKCQEATFCS